MMRLHAAPKPLSANLMKDVRKKACGFAGIEPLICCPSYDILPRSFREVTTEKPWIWDVSNSQTKPMKVKPTNLYNRLNTDVNSWGHQNNPSRPNDLNTPQKPDKHFFTRKTKKYHFFDFEDPRTFRNCPPSFSPDFHIPPNFQHVKPIKNFHHVSQSEPNGFDSNSVDNEPDFVFPTSPGDGPQLTFPSRVAKYPLEKLNLINAENCGISINSRIIGGDEAVPGQFPW